MLLSALALGLYTRIAWPWMPLGWVALVPWLAVLDRTTSWRAVLEAALLMAIAFEVAAFGWFPHAIETYTKIPGAVAVVLIVLLAPLLQPQVFALALARHLARWRGASRSRAALAGTLAWVAAEWACPKLFGDTLGYGLWPSAWMRQAADVAGVPGLTLVLLLGNECTLAAVRALASGARRRVLAPAAGLAALVLALLGYGALRERTLAADPGRPDAVRAGIVQADITRYGRLAAESGTFVAVRTILDAHFALSAKLLRRSPLDLIVWPETVYPTTFGSPKSAAGAEFDRDIARFVARNGIPLVFGAYDAEGGAEFNAAVFLEPAARGPLEFETYRKASLFPLTERVPDMLGGESVRHWLPWMGTWAPGAGGEVVPLHLGDGRTVRVAPLICYDALAPALVRQAVRDGAEVIVTLSNDGWFADGPAPWLHLVGAAFRSIETRRPQLRATNSGISAVIDASGAILARTDVDRRAVLAATVTPEAHAATLVLRWGEWLGPLALALGVALVAAPLSRRRAAS